MLKKRLAGAVGGTIGYVKAKSVPSLVAGMSIAALYAFAGSRVALRGSYGPEIAVAVSIVLLGMMGPKAIRTAAPVSVIMSTVGLVGALFYASLILKTMNNHLSQYKALVQAEQATKVSKVYIALAGILFVSFSVLFNVLHVFTTNVIATVVPTIRFLEAAQKGDVESLKVYGFYFSLLAIIDVSEDLFYDYILYYNPYWWAQKLVLVGWLIFPQYLVRMPFF
ncbi:hypothetical protein HDU82_008346 [Entophlyctis luteolus]|nr:hypothetical protein HDU82_008346 [Entophlyctis luteolus]